MTNLPAALRAELAEQVPFSSLVLEREGRSRDGTVKALFRTREGLPVEAVLMRYRDGRRSVCLSSQSGCPLTCTFCATGAMRFGRNLSAGEILDQALHFRRYDLGSRCPSRMRCPARRTSKPAGRGNPTAGWFDSIAAPLRGVRRRREGLAPRAPRLGGPRRGPHTFPSGRTCHRGW